MRNPNVLRACIVAVMAAGCGGTDPKKQGWVAMVLQPLQPPKGAVLGASFEDGSPSPTSCAPVVVGPCLVYPNCAPQERSAGTITAVGSSGSIAIRNPYPRPAMAFGDFVWAPGSPITLSGSGADVPAFSAVVTPPGAPTFTGSIAATTSRDADLPLTWSLAAPGDRFFAVVYGYGGTLPVVADCAFPPGDLAGTIPSAALGMLPQGQCWITLSSIDEQEAAAGDWTIHTSARTQAVDQAGGTNLLLVTTLM